MSLAETFLQPALWLAIALFTLGGLVLMPLVWLIEARLPSRLLQWQWEHVAMPLVRILLLLFFIILAWPELYGIHTAPDAIARLSADSGRGIQLINLLFVLSVILPLIPVLGGWHALTLPLQGITAVALIFSWIPDHHAALSAYWPGWLTVLMLVVLAWLAYQIAVSMGEYLGHDMDTRWHLAGSHEFISNILLLILQAPIIIIYAHSLGSHLN